MSCNREQKSMIILLVPYVILCNMQGTCHNSRVFLTTKFTYLVGRALAVNVVVCGRTILCVVACRAVRFRSFTEKLSQSGRLRG